MEHKTSHLIRRPGAESADGEARTSPFLSVVLSFFNEADNLAELLNRLRKALRGEVAAGHLSCYELVFVNDASTDDSEKILRREADAGGDLLIVTMSHNFGVSPCVLAGMAHSAGDLVVYMDADLQDPPELIPRMLEVWRDTGDVDVVNTVRVQREGESRLKLFLTRLGYRILTTISDVEIPENAGDFKLLSRRVVNHLVGMNEKLPFVRGMVYWVGYKQTVVHYDREPRQRGRTKFPVCSSRVIRNFLFSALISFSTTPLVFTVVLGLLTSMLSSALLLYTLIQWILLREVTQGWTTLMATISLLGGMQLLTNGINGLYINTIFHETKQRPTYIVRSIYGSTGRRSRAGVSDHIEPISDDRPSVVARVNDPVETLKS